MAGEDRKLFYWRLKVMGVGIFIPISLALGPVAGYFLGAFLVKKFNLPVYVVFVCITLGLLSSVLETIRMIKFLLREDKA